MSVVIWLRVPFGVRCLFAVCTFGCLLVCLCLLACLLWLCVSSCSSLLDCLFAYLFVCLFVLLSDSFFVAVFCLFIEFRCCLIVCCLFAC